MEDPTKQTAADAGAPSVHELEAELTNAEDRRRRLEEAVAMAQAAGDHIVAQGLNDEARNQIGAVYDLRDQLARRRAEVEAETRAAADGVTQRTLAANERMATASADAARWAKWAAIFTAVAAAVTAAVAIWEHLAPRG